MGTTNGLTLPSFLIVPQLRSLVSFLSQKQSLFTLPSVPKNSSTHPLSRVNSYLLASFFSVLNFIFGRPVFVSLRNQAQKYIPGIYGKVNTKKKKHPPNKQNAVHRYCRLPSGFRRLCRCHAPCLPHQRDRRPRLRRNGHGNAVRREAGAGSGQSDGVVRGRHGGACVRGLLVDVSRRGLRHRGLAARADRR